MTSPLGVACKLSLTCNLCKNFFEPYSCHHTSNRLDSKQRIRRPEHFRASDSSYMLDYAARYKFYVCMYVFPVKGVHDNPFQQVYPWRPSFRSWTHFPSDECAAKQRTSWFVLPATQISLSKNLQKNSAAPSEGKPTKFVIITHRMTFHVIFSRISTGWVIIIRCQYIKCAWTVSQHTIIVCFTLTVRKSTTLNIGNIGTGLSATITPRYRSALATTGTCLQHSENGPCSLICVTRISGTWRI